MPENYGYPWIQIADGGVNTTNILSPTRLYTAPSYIGNMWKMGASEQWSTTGSAVWAYRNSDADKVIVVVVGDNPIVYTVPSNNVLAEVAVGVGALADYQSWIKAGWRCGFLKQSYNFSSYSYVQTESLLDNAPIRMDAYSPIYNTTARTGAAGKSGDQHFGAAFTWEYPNSRGYTLLSSGTISIHSALLKTIDLSLSGTANTRTQARFKSYSGVKPTVELVLHDNV